MRDPDALRAGTAGFAGAIAVGRGGGGSSLAAGFLDGRSGAS
ncbi:hypothetical protein [Streptomyces koyangensis]|nr:hypothetical protein [Streptomyces koyangensis]